MNAVMFPVFYTRQVPQAGLRGKQASTRTIGKQKQVPVAIAMKPSQAKFEKRPPSFQRQMEIIERVGSKQFAEQAGLCVLTVHRYMLGMNCHRATERVVIQTCMNFDRLSFLV